MENEEIKFNKYLLSSYWVLGARNEKVTGKRTLFFRCSQSNEVCLGNRAEEREGHKKDVKLLEQQRDLKKGLLTERASYAKTQDTHSIWAKALSDAG